MSTPTEAHRLIVTRAMACEHPQQFNGVLQLLADSEARAVEAATDTAEVYRVQAQYANHQLTAARERVRVLEEALKPFAALGDSAGFDNETPDETPVISGRSAIDSFMGTKRTIVSVGNIRSARAALATPERKEGEQ